MFGITRMRRRLRRFRYNNQSRFPRLFLIFDMAKLPLQILAVALPLWLAVSFYDNNFSYQAKNERAARQRAVQEITVDTRGTEVAIDRREIESQAAIEPAEPVEVADSASSDEENQLLKPEGELIATAQISENNSLRHAQDKLAELDDMVATIVGPAAIHRSETAATAPAAQATLHDAGWLSEQSDASYVIQFESSANVERMKEQALALTTVGDLALYPFKVSRQGDVIYGLSYGLYDTLDEAKAATADLPPELRRFGSWIRQVGFLKKQMDTVGNPANQVE